MPEKPEHDNTVDERVTLPVLPLRQMVLFPGVTAPIGAGRPGTLRAIEAAVKTDDRLVFAVCQRDNVDKVQPGILHTVGTIARIGQIQRGLGGIQLLLQGERRAAALQYMEKDGHLEAVVSPIADIPPLEPEGTAFLGLYKEVRERAEELGRKIGITDEMVAQVLEGVSDPGAFSDFVAGYLDVSAMDKQIILEMASVEDRLRAVLVHVQRQLELLDVQEDIKSQVQEEIGQRQRELFLREQLKAIRRELGEEEENSELETLRRQLEDLHLPDTVWPEVERELVRLERTSKESMEAQVIRTYLELVAGLPWNTRSEEHLNLDEAAAVLDADHYGLRDVKDRVLEFLAVRRLRAEHAEQSETPPGNEDDRSKAPILLFGGPPGVGKTSIAQSIARAMGRKYVRISLGGIRDEADIRGHRRTYVGAMPGRIIQGLKQAGTRNPVFLLDEVDKLSASFQGDPAAALLEVLDPAQNHSFTDHYLGVPFDLSEVLFIATANFVQNIPAPLLDRMELVEFSGYTEREKLAISRTYLVPRQLREAGLEAEQFELTDDALRRLISQYTREAGVRQLEREIGRLARKVARRIATGDVERVTVDADDIRELLGRARVHPEHAAAGDEVGVATGMYYTPVGGDIMFVEVAVTPGKGDLVLTGQLGDVMKESARAALTYARAHAAELGIPRQRLTDQDIHIHVPAGAVPKDGPSAGVTMATALVSALSNTPVRSDVAMTGEITLSGKVLPIGGVKEKVLGACRAGINRIILPEKNLPDLEDLTQEDRDRITVYPVRTLAEVLELALRPATEPRMFGVGDPDGMVPSHN